MKIVKKYIEVCEFEIILSDKLLNALRVIENLPKTIVSIDLIDMPFTNLAILFDWAGDTYYYMYELYMFSANTTAISTFSYALVQGATVDVESPVSIWNAGGTPAINYQRSWFIHDLLFQCVNTSSTFTNGHAFGLKINTS